KYTYSDADGDEEGDSLYQWLRSSGTTNSRANRGFIAIPGASQNTYQVTEEDVNTQLSIEVTPIAKTGETKGKSTRPDPETNSEGVTQLVDALPDTSAPVITINGDNPASVVQSSVYTDAGATATDNIDGTVAVTSSGSVNTNTVGSYTITYRATDAAGNTATAARVVNVVLAPDTTAPVITINGDNPLDVLQGSNYIDAGATATDAIDGNVTVTVSGLVNTAELKQYVLTYTATDAAGNIATATRTVNVVAAQATLAQSHRLLLQTTFGPTQSNLERVQLIGVNEWIDEQLVKPSAYDNTADGHKTHLERMIQIAQEAQPDVAWYGTAIFNQQEAAFTADEYQMAAWWENAIGLHPNNTLHGSDQLRQRVAYALSQLLVTSAYEPPLHRRGEALAAYYDILAGNAFGNYRTLLGEMARSPAMGIYLSHQGNRKADETAGTRPDENFARELMQLFTIGLYQLNNNGTPDYDGDPTTLEDVKAELVPSYTQADIEELAKVMTGWDLVDNPAYGKNSNTHGDYTKPMEFTESEHEQGTITLLGQSVNLSSGSDNSGMDAALDVLFNHPNVGPYVSRHLIMRLVTSNPSAAYINRVASIFNNDGNGVRGNLKAVVRAILADDEARNDAGATTDSFGKFKEPLLAWTQLLRATDAIPLNGWKSKDGSTLVSGVYWFKAPEKYFGQGPMRSPSVFNFYSPDYVPSDVAFSASGLVGPEFQIQTDQIFLEYNNKLVTQINTYEKNKIIIEDSSTPELLAGTKSFSNDPLMLISFDKELAVMKQALGDDYDNIENTDTDNLPFREKAVDALLVHLDQLFLGETMTAEYKAALKEYLLNASGVKNQDNFKEVLNIVQNAVRMIAASGLYMVQK
ncbi:MAG: DUF1800 family protein, partial [Thiolinea sp.]